MKFSAVALLAFVFAGCSEQADRFTTSGHTLVHGQVYLDKHQPDATVRVFSVGPNAKKSHELAVAQTDAKGEWDVDLQAYEGPIWVTAEGASIEGSLDAYEEAISAGVGIRNVSVTPVSHLSAAYARYLTSKNVKFPEAARIASAQMSELMGGVHHQRVAPSAWPTRPDPSEAVALTDSVASSLIFSSLNDLVRQISVQNGVAPNTVVTLEKLLSALAEDVEADGIFDGFGKSGKALKLRDTALTSSTLRTDLALAMVRYINSKEHNTILGKKEIEPLAHSLASNQGPLFSDRARSFSTKGPIFNGCEIHASDKVHTQIDWPQHGSVTFVCHWESDLKITASSADLADGQDSLNIRRNDYKDSVLVFDVDTSKLDNGSHQLIVSATDVSGNVSQDRLSLETLNGPPDLTLSSDVIWVNGESPISLSGGSNRTLRYIYVRPLLDSSPVTFEVSSKPADTGGMTFAVPYDDFRFDSSYYISIEGEDWAGNKARKNVLLVCETRSPSINLQSFSFQGDFGGQLVSIDDDSWSDKPVSFNKFYNKMDFLPEDGLDANVQNIPSLVFSLNLPTSHLEQEEAKSVRASYRYIHHGEGSSSSEWKDLYPGDDGLYAIPLSYQTLLPSEILSLTPRARRVENFIATSEDQSLHVVEIKAVDKAGNTNIRAFPFHLILRSPPLSLNHCGLTKDFESLNYQNLDSLVLANNPIFKPTISWPVSLPANSIAPYPELTASISGFRSFDVYSLEQRAWSKKVDHGDASPDFASNALACIQKSKNKKKAVYWADGRCSQEGRPKDRRNSVYSSLLRASVLRNKVILNSNSGSLQVPVFLTDIHKEVSLASVTNPEREKRYIKKKLLGHLSDPLILIEETETFEKLCMSIPHFFVSFQETRGSVPGPSEVIRDDSCNLHPFLIRHQPIP